MGIGTSLLLIAVGAVLKFAVTATTSGINIQTVGVILMIVGAVGLLLTLIWYVNHRERYVAADRTYSADPTVPRTPPPAL